MGELTCFSCSHIEAHSQTCIKAIRTANAKLLTQSSTKYCGKINCSQMLGLLNHIIFDARQKKMKLFNRFLLPKLCPITQSEEKNYHTSMHPWKWGKLSRQKEWFTVWKHMKYNTDWTNISDNVLSLAAGSIKGGLILYRSSQCLLFSCRWLPIFPSSNI